MDKVKFKLISRAKFNALASKDPSTIYFINNEHVLYKGNQEYGGVQSITYTQLKDSGYLYGYALTITKDDGTTDTINIGEAAALNNLRNNFLSHQRTPSKEDVMAHVYLTDTIDASNPKEVTDAFAVTPKAVIDYVGGHQENNIIFTQIIDTSSTGQADTLYLELDTGYLWIYDTDNSIWVNTSNKSWNNIWSNITNIVCDIN